MAIRQGNNVHRRSALAALAALALVASACGSDDSGDAASETTAATATTAGASETSAPPETSAPDGQSTTTAGGAPETSAPPATGEPVEIGIFITKEGPNAAGFEEFVQGNAQAQAQAIIDDLNANGGLYGSEIVPIFVEKDTRGSLPYAQVDQAACATWFEDHDVKTVLNLSVVPTEVLVTCTTDRGVPLIDVSASLGRGTSFWTDNPLLFTPIVIDWNALAPVLVEQLGAQDFFTGWDAAAGQPGDQPVTIGVLYDDDEWIPDVLENALAPALAAQDLEIAEQVAISPWGPEAPAENIARSRSELQNAVLRFKSAGVTHVIPIGSAKLVSFATSAVGQDYFPRYAINTLEQPVGQALTPGGAGHFSGAVGVGFNPYLDVFEQQDPGLSPAGERCLDLVRAAGEDMSKRVTQSNAARICEALWVLDAGVAAGGGLAPEQIAAGIESLGSSSYEPAATFVSAFGPDRRYGPGAVRAMAFDDSCQCFQYTSDDIPVGDAG